MPIMQRPAHSRPINLPPRDFTEDLKFSEGADLKPFWDAAFKKIFPNMVFYEVNAADNTAQRRGVDCLLYLGVDKWIRVDQKADRYEPKNYFLEYVSVDNPFAKGWIEKPLATDYIAYGFVNHGRCDLLPWHGLRLAWKANGEAWKRVYGEKSIQNKGYKTYGCPVPIPIVQQAIAFALSVEVTL